MSKVIASLVIFFVLLAPTAWAQESEAETVDEVVPEVSELSIGETVISYGEAVEITGGVLYYNTNTDEPDALLVASAHDTDGDDAHDVWIAYNEAAEATLEGYDTTGDGSADLIVELDGAEQVTDIEGESAAEYQRGEGLPFEPAPVELSGIDDTDLVGDLSDITIAEPTNNWIFFVILFLTGGVLYLFWQRQKDE